MFSRFVIAVLLCAAAVVGCRKQDSQTTSRPAGGHTEIVLTDDPGTGGGTGTGGATGTSGGDFLVDTSVGKVTQSRPAASIPAFPSPQIRPRPDNGALVAAPVPAPETAPAPEENPYPQPESAPSLPVPQPQPASKPQVTVVASSTKPAAGATTMEDLPPDKVNVAVPEGATVEAHMLPGKATMPATQNSPDAPPTATAPAITVPTVTDVRTEMAAGDKALAAGDKQTALKHYSKAVEIEPTNLDALQGLATALVAAGKHQEVLTIYDTIIGVAESADPADKSAHAAAAAAGKTAWYNKAVALCRTGKQEQAVDLYVELLKKHEDFVEARYNLAVLYQATGRLKQSLAQWEKVVAAQPKLASAWAAMGEAQMDSGDAAAAVKAFAEVAKLAPDDCAAWYNLALAHRAAGNLGLATAVTRKALEINPKDAEGWVQLGQLLLETHRQSGKREHLQSAVECWRRALELGSKRTELKTLIETYDVVLTHEAASTSAPAN